VSGSRHSIRRGDVVLSNLPPYSTQPWLSMGVVVHYALLAQAGLRARVVRPVDPPFFVPRATADASLRTLTFDPPLAERMAAMERAYREAPAFFDGMVDELLAGPEEVVGLSLFRNNADVSLWAAKLLKERRPSAFVVLGGPEAIEEPAALELPWVDAVVGVDAEAVFVPLVRALLERRPERAAGLRNVWLNPALHPRRTDPLLRPPLPVPAFPAIDYEPLMQLFVGDPQATVPLLLNWGCPYNCGFCSNRSVYSRFTQGSTARVLSEMDAAVARWRDLHAGSPPALNLQFSDATTNAIPGQLDDLLHAVVSRAPRWGTPPLLRGQTLFDTRITEPRVRLMGEANFFSTFFGLDGASDDLRRSLQKPASVAQVVAAMEVYHRGGRGGLSFGVPVGIPGETELHFRAAEHFVDQALRLEGTLDTITVLPYLFGLTAQDPELARMNRGERRGVLWRADVPGGDPAERARRMMRMFERIDKRAPANSPIPPYLALPAMLPDEDPAHLEAWMARHGREFDQITPLHEQAPRGAPPAPSPLWARAEGALQAGRRYGAWVMDALQSNAYGGARAGLVALFHREGGGESSAILLEPRDAARKAFARTRDFNVSYLRQWQGKDCGFDEGLMRACVTALTRIEGAEEQPRG
jgi:hypothetical protein